MDRMATWCMALVLGTGALVTGACQAREGVLMPESSPPGSEQGVDAVVGLWTVVPRDGSGTCTLALNRLSVPGGFGVQVERCAMADLRSVESWRLTPEGFDLVAKSGNAARAFRRTGEDSFEAVDGTSRMERAPLA